MSLLMDALRRAEEEKRRAEARLLERQESVEVRAAGTTPTGTEPMPRPAGGTQVGPASAVRLELEPRSPASDAAGGTGSYTGREDYPPTLPAGFDEGPQAEALILGGGALPSSSDPDADGTRESLRGGVVDNDATRPSDQALRSSLREFFDASQSLNLPRTQASERLEDSLRDVLKRDDSSGPEHMPPLEASAEARDFRSGTSARVSAQAVLAATKRGSSARLLQFLFAGLFLVTVGLGVLAFYWLNTSLAPPRSVPSPRVAAEIEHLAAPEPSPPPPAPTPAATPVPTPAPPLVPVEAATPAANVTPGTSISVVPAPAVAVAADPGGRSAFRPTEAADPADRTAFRPTEAADPAETPKPETGTPAPTEPAPLLVAPDDAAPIASAVMISRSRQAATLAPELMNAYAAWRRGDVALAESLYRQVLARQPRQRDALLGLAAIRLKAGDVSAAEARYQEVLHDHPKDSVATAALFNLRAGQTEQVDAARLKLLLDEEPAAGHVYFALGNRYAREQRWREAQAAYFEAVRLDVENPDYAYNLGIALDRIGSRSAAAQHYRRALGLAARRPAGFPRAQIESRLRWLEAHPTP